MYKKIDNAVKDLYLSTVKEMNFYRDKVREHDNHCFELSAILTAKKFAWINVHKIELINGNHYIIRRANGKVKRKPCLAKWVGICEGWKYLVGSVSPDHATNATIEVYIGVE